jgi:hypothetical protein
VVLFACERILAMGASTASVDLLHGDRKKAADAHTMASSIWYIFGPPLAKIPGHAPYRATNVIWLQLFCAVPVADSATQQQNSFWRSHSRGPHTVKEDHGETRKFNIYKKK